MARRGCIARRGPLKKVIGEWCGTWTYSDGHTINNVMIERLECGHIQRVPRDFYGEYWAYRRRCGQCYKQKLGVAA